MGESITFLSGDLTEKINPKTKSIVISKIIKTNLSEILFIRLIIGLNFYQVLSFRKSQENMI